MNNLINANQTLTMSSREIAELTGKEHFNVKRDIIAMIMQLNYPSTPLKHCPKFNPSELKGHGVEFGKFDHKGNSYELFTLNKRYAELLITGYSATLRLKVIDRLYEMEELAKPEQPKIPTNFAEALQLAADQAKQLELAAPKVAFVDNLVSRDNLMTATQVASKHKMSAVKLNKVLDELGGVYNQSVKRGRVFIQSFIESGYGELKQTEQGYSQALFTPAGEVYINEKLISEGVV